MRARRALATRGTLNARGRLSHETVVLIAMALVALWLLWSLARAIALERSLNRQAAELQAQNAALRAANAAYRRDITAVSSGAAVEEDARMNGYARSGERLYLVGQPPASPPPAAGGGEGDLGPDSPAQVLWGIVSAPFRR
ncbi:MAG TPA: septum formation initiator family protein [Candidatus Dormibacteraeota bacterium]|nr:septum formation initiator family protein [Candidatus Dormibacteraeota bacterium]